MKIYMVSLLHRATINNPINLRCRRKLSYELNLEISLVSLQVVNIQKWTVVMQNYLKTRMWANAQPDGRPAEYRWRPLFNAAKFR